MCDCHGVHLLPLCVHRATTSLRRALFKPANARIVRWRACKYWACACDVASCACTVRRVTSRSIHLTPVCNHSRARVITGLLQMIGITSTVSKTRRSVCVLVCRPVGRHAHKLKNGCVSSSESDEREVYCSTLSRTFWGPRNSLFT